MSDLLLEIGTEELPAGYIEPALAALRAGFVAKMEDHGFKLAADAVNVTGTPRRLVLWARDLPDKSASSRERLQGPPRERAFDQDGKPTKAAEGFARKCGVSVSDLKVEGKYVVAEVARGGEPALAVLKGILPELIAGLPFPKSMRWIPGSRVTFARPVRGLLGLLGKQVVPFEFAGLTAGRESAGHAFHAPESFALRDARYYEFLEVLRGRKVILDMAERRERVMACAAKGAQKAEGRLYNRNGAAERLAAEVANLVEWPGAVIGSFDEQICRELPAEAIVAALTLHQRYFPIEDSEGRLLPRFVAIANRDPQAGGQAAVIRAGNERVLRARLADALFFWREDKKVPLDARLAALEGVAFHARLGNMRQKSERVAELAGWLARESGESAEVIAAAERAGLLAKCDLVTKMVFEFPELQGVMGRHYARAGGEPEAVALAIEEHYLPRAAAADLPKGAAGRLVALADKFDSLAGGFAAGLAPTGSKDPYALRRAAIGALHIIREGQLFAKGPGLKAILDKALGLYRAQGLLGTSGGEAAGQVIAFLRDRLESALVEQAGRVEILRAVLGTGFDNLAEFDARLAAVAELARRPEFPALCTVVERARNIVRGAAVASAPEESRLVEPEERALFAVYQDAAARFRAALSAGKYFEASDLYLASFAKPLHVFFEKVFVNAEDAALKANRLALLSAIYRLYADSIADLAECAGRVSDPAPARPRPT